MSEAYELAQVNIARLLAPLDSDLLQDFVAALDDINAQAEAAPGFRWRLADDSGNATGISAFAWDAEETVGVIVNLSVWARVEDLRSYIYSGRHVAALRRRREWFHKVDAATTALWWVPAGQRPTVDDAELRVRHLRANRAPMRSCCARRSTPRQTGSAIPVFAWHRYPCGTLCKYCWW